jgi:nucleoside triphosphate diphosphatase
VPPRKSRSSQPARRKAQVAKRSSAGVGRGAGGSVRRAEGKTRKRDAGHLFEDLLALQARLRAPNGCPWDREQTHDSLRTYLVEETYEVLDALESRDWPEFAGELGDLLLQVVFHAELAAEAGRFDISDVITRIHNKMVSRHPHVFGKVKARTSADVLKNWEQLKAEERRAAKKPAGELPAEAAKPESVLDGVPRTLPALLEAHQLTRRAANVGFDWRDVEGLFDKLVEETRELREALAARDRRRYEEEVGDLLFVGVNLARFLGLDAEIALKSANRKFSQRFRMMEREAASQGRKLSALSADELESLWDRAKTSSPPLASDSAGEQNAKRANRSNRT